MRGRGREGGTEERKGTRRKGEGGEGGGGRGGEGEMEGKEGGKEGERDGQRRKKSVVEGERGEDIEIIKCTSSIRLNQKFLIKWVVSVAKES